MTRRILSLLLALCLVVGLLPMIALAEEAEAPALTATLEVNSGKNPTPAKFAPKMSEGMAPAYAKTVDGLITTEGASEADYNLKAEWPTGGKPTLTMKDATIHNDCRNTLTNNNNNVAHSIIIGGSADFVIMVIGTNTILGGSGFADGNVSAYRCPTGIQAFNTGSLTIRGTGKNESSLLIGNLGGNGVENRYNAINIENTKFHIQLYNTTNQYPQTGMLMQYKDAAYKDMTDLNVTNSDFAIKIGDYSGASSNPYASLAIIMAGTKEEYASDNAGDLSFQNSTVYFYRNSGSGQTTPLVRQGSGSKTTFDRCDMSSCYSWRVVFYYLPTVLNYDTCTYVPNGTGSTTTYAIADAGSAQQLRNLKMTHTCLAGEPIVIKPVGECATQQTTLTKCVVCDKELSRVEEDLSEQPSKGHTPGAKVELTDQRVGVIGTGTMSKLGLVPKSEGSSYYKPATGKYVFQYTCSVCGEVWTEEEEFKPAMLFFISSGKGSWYEGGGYYNYNTGAGDNSSSSYKPTVAIGPGQVKYYTTGEYDANNPGYYYMKALTDEAQIAAGNWNVKFEYPLYGDPILTFRNATIINNAGLWYGYAAYRDLAPLTIVLEGTNYLGQAYSTSGCGPLTLQTANNVTITGDGTLHLESYGHGRGLGIKEGTLTLDNIDLTMVRGNIFAGSTRGHAIGSDAGGSVIINGGSITYLGYGRVTSTSKTNEETGVTTVTNTYTPGHTSLIQGKDVTINGATISAVGTFVGSDSSTTFRGIIYASNDLTITESSLFLAHGYAYAKEEGKTYTASSNLDADALRCGGTLTLNYANGIIGETSNASSYASNPLDVATTVFPSDKTAITSIDGVVSAKTNRYLQIAPTKELANFTGTAVTIKDDLDVSFQMAANKVDQAGTVKFTVNGQEIEKNLSEVGVTEGDNYVITLPGLSAKQMRDEITVTVYDSEGNVASETRSDSVVDYALRLLRGKQYAADTEINNALKTFVADMLVYGSMAQIQFGQPGEALVTDVLTATEWNYVTAAAPEATKTPATTSNAGYVGTSFELKSNIGMAVALYAETLPDVTYAKVTFTDYLGNPKEFTVATKDATSNSKYTVFVFNELAAANGRQDITWTFYNAENEVQLTVTDSLANYVGRMRDAYPYVDELLKYCDSAKTYFTLANAQ